MSSNSPREIIADPPVKGVWEDEYPSEYDKDLVDKRIDEKIAEALTNTSIAGLLIDNTIPQSKIIGLEFKQPTGWISAGQTTGFTVDGGSHDFGFTGVVYSSVQSPDFIRDGGYTQFRMKVMIYFTALNGCTSFNFQIQTNHHFIATNTVYSVTFVPVAGTPMGFDSKWIDIPKAVTDQTNTYSPNYLFNTAGGNPTVGYMFAGSEVR